MVSATEEETTGFGWFPEEIIHQILSFLSEDGKKKARDLSKEWFDAFRTYPKLSFNGINQQDFNNTLARHNFGRVSFPYRLEITMEFKNNDEDAANMDKWLKIALENGVRELKMNLSSFCDDLSEVKLINVPRLRELHIYHLKHSIHRDYDLKVEIDAPNSFQPYINLQRLTLEGTTIVTERFFMVKFPHLRSLVIPSFKDFARENLTSNSLEKLEFKPSNDLPVQKLEVDSPNLFSFHLCLLYVDIFPKVSFMSLVQPHIKSEVSLWYASDMDNCCFLMMEEMLSSLVPSRISLHIDIESDFDLDESESLEESFTGFAASFLVCYPEIVTLRIVMNERASRVVGCLQRKLEDAESGPGEGIQGVSCSQGWEKMPGKAARLDEFIKCCMQGM
ncbi:OLC1v1020626C1 [Oldenlandia corymbosa var. corymbosa]|uniref:OLC1v1020626C1 n=1 Tax=Oldenlandia corymbosa var. corymbosa TaxID=529605 RepID=A0AAV1EH60_OLDCO|nr:OLC1v1020626C1 [Oldenlandia corymbosa var. corymbosa]